MHHLEGEARGMLHHLAALWDAARQREDEPAQRVDVLVDIVFIVDIGFGLRDVVFLVVVVLLI